MGHSKSQITETTDTGVRLYYGRYSILASMVLKI